MLSPCVCADGRRVAQLLLLHLCEQVPERGVPRDAGRDHQQSVTKIQGWERQTSPLPSEMTVSCSKLKALKSHHITSAARHNSPPPPPPPPAPSRHPPDKQRVKSRLPYARRGRNKHRRDTGAKGLVG